MNSLPLILEYFTNNAWCIDEVVFNQLAQVVDRHVRGEKLSAAEIAAATNPKNAPGQPDRVYEVVGSTAIIPVTGVIARHSRMVNGSSKPRGISCEMLTDWVNTAAADASVERVILAIDSPGGSVFGVPELADALYALSQNKPLDAHIDGLGCSAAYYLASQANRIYATQSACVGSIGVIAAVVDSSEAAEKAGLKYHYIRTGENKGVGSPGLEVTDANVEALQTYIDSLYGDFCAAVLRGRDNLSEKALKTLADGRVYSARDAECYGLIDGLCSFEQLLENDPPATRKTNSEPAAKSVETNTQSLNVKEQPTMTENATTPEAAGQTQANAADILATERLRVAAIDKVLAGDAYAEVRSKAQAEGWSVEAAKAAAFDVAQSAHAEAIAAKDATIAEQSTRLDAIAAGAPEITAPPASDAKVGEEAEAGANASSEYDKCILAAVAAGQPEGTARIAAARKHPKAHKDWVKKQQANKD